jgi:hypothetical protein
MIIDSADPSAARIAASFSASAILMLAALSPSEVKILALFLLSASAYRIIDFEMLLGGSMSLISYLRAKMPQLLVSLLID